MRDGDIRTGNAARTTGFRNRRNFSEQAQAVSAEGVNREVVGLSLKLNPSQVQMQDTIVSA